MKKNTIIFIFCFLLIGIFILQHEKKNIGSTSPSHPNVNLNGAYWEKWLALR